MTNKRKLALTLLLGAVLALEALAVMMHRKMWPFLPITMFSGTYGRNYTALKIVVTEMNGKEVVLTQEDGFGDYSYSLISTFIGRNPEQQAAVRWAAEQHAEQRRRDHKALPKTFSVARITWRLEPHGSTRSNWIRKQTLVEHTY